MFGDVVLGMDKDVYENIIKEVKDKKGIDNDALLRTDDLQSIVSQFKSLVTIPDDPWIQLEMAIEAIFKSWNSPRARKYRDIHNINDDMGTAVVLQSMVYGNMNSISGSGVVFTRNPSTGDKEMYGEYLWLAEGEDVVSGMRTPVKLDFLQLKQPTVYDTIFHSLNILESHFKDTQVRI
jgi:pyruvate,orthophosphate dikinase